MVKHIIQIGNELLLKKSLPIPESELNTKKHEDLYQNLLDTCVYYEDEAAGLSAVQIGSLKRVFVVRRIDLERDENYEMEETEWELMINPEITDSSETLSTEWEGCMSINKAEGKLFGPVKRSDSVTVKYLDREGEEKMLEASGFFSHLIQHEMDHLNGILFLKHVENPENIWQEKELDKYLKEHRSFPEIK